MTNPLYNENFQGQPGQTARAEQVRDELAAVESAFDQVAALTDRSLKGAIGEVLAALPSASNRAGMFLKFNNVTGQPEAVQAGLTWRGVWAINTAYVVGDIVSSDPLGTVYVCVVSHTSASSGSIDITKFEVMISGQSSGHNLIINGNFDIWQRGTSLSAATTSRFLADRWKTGGTGSTVAPSRQSFALGQTDVPNEPTYFHRFVVVSSAGANNLANCTYKVEGVRALSGRTATLSFWAKADSNKSMSVEFIYDFGTGGSPSGSVFAIGTLKINLTSSWQKFTHTVNFPSISGKVLGTNGNDNLTFHFWFDAGSNFNARTGSLGQQSGTFDIAQVQLEEGSVATAFESRPKGEELILCQRYYEKSYSQGVTPGTVSSEGATAYFLDAQTSVARIFRGHSTFRVTKRAVPTVVVYSTVTGTLNRMHDFSSVADVVPESFPFLGETGFSAQATQGSAATRVDATWQWTADAEL